ncbi:MAG: hypothetical protein ACLVJO_10250 [[Clostridium] scindens]
MIVIDGSLVPQFGVLEQPVKIYMKNGVIDHVEGGAIAEQWKNICGTSSIPRCCVRPTFAWDSTRMQNLRTTLGEDERIYGGPSGALGQLALPDAANGIPAPSHIDATCLRVSIYLDGVAITQDGEIVDEELKYAARLGR